MEPKASAPDRWRRWAREHAPTQLLPAIAVTVAALVFMGPGKPRPVFGVRVLGVADAGATLAVRLVGVRRLLNVDDAAALDDVHVQASEGGAALGTWQGALGDDGVADAVVQLSRAPERHVDVRVERGSTVLASGQVNVAPPQTTFATLATIPGRATGELIIRVDSLRAQLAAPFPDQLRISVQAREGKRAGGIAIDMSAEGAKVTPEHAVLIEQGSVTVDVTALAHTVPLIVEAHDPLGRAGHWDGNLPVVPGAIWLDPRRPDGIEGAYRIVSPAPRSRAYVSFLTEQGRVFGAIVPLQTDAQGFFSGIVKPTIPGAARMLYAIVSGDALERSGATVVWPIRPPEGALPMRRVQMMLDGIPDAEGREKARLRRARHIAIAVIGLAAIAQMLLLIRRSRAAERRLRAHIRAAAARFAKPTAAEGEPDAREAQADLARLTANGSPLLTMTLVVALVALGFAMVAALATFH